MTQLNIHPLAMTLATVCAAALLVACSDDPNKGTSATGAGSAGNGGSGGSTSDSSSVGAGGTGGGGAVGGAGGSGGGVAPFTEIIVGDRDDAILVFDIDASGDVVPKRRIAGDNTRLNFLWGIALAESSQELIVTAGGGSVLYFPITGDGNIFPIRELAGDATMVTFPVGIGYHAATDTIFVNNDEPPGGVFSFARTAGGNIPPLRRIEDMTFHNSVWVRDGTDEIYVTQHVQAAISVFPVDGDGDIAPTRVIGGPATTLHLPSHGYVDEDNGEVAVADYGASTDAVITFAVDADGDVAPIRSIRGAATTFQKPYDVAHDPTNDEIFVVDGITQAVLVFDRTDDGDVAPKRVIAGASTGFSHPAWVVLAR